MRPSWDAVWLSIAKTIALRSRCEKAQVGSVIVDTKQRSVAMGYNGPASTFVGKGGCTNWCGRAQNKQTDGAYDNCPSIHSEANALLYVDRSAVEGSTLYITHPPCMGCAKLISNSGIAKVVFEQGEADKHRNPEKVIQFLHECGIPCYSYER